MGSEGTLLTRLFCSVTAGWIIRLPIVCSHSASCSFSEVEASCHRELCHDGRQMMTSHRAPFLDSGDPKGARHDRAAQSFISNAPEQPESGLSLSFIGNKGCHCNQETGNCFTYKTCLISSGLDTTEQLLFIALFYTSFSGIWPI